MTLRTRTTGRTRQAFTIIEILVVVTIIILIMGLLMAAVQKARESAKRTEAQGEIREMGTAIGTFKNKMNVNYIPSRLKICERWTDYGGTQLDVDSQNWFTSCFGQGIVGQNIDWNGNGSINSAVVLEGDQVLVFALGGPQGTQGFSMDVKNPARAPIAGENRKGPFVKFLPNRLIDRTGQGYPSYQDVWESNYYAYFSSHGAKSNSYNRYGSSDCASLGLSPYQSAANKFWLPDSFQIITAGPDGRFGAGGQWPPLTDTNGRDDMATFSKYQLEANSPD